MLGKIPPIALGPAGLALIVAIAVVGFILLVQPKQKEIEGVRGQIAQEQSKAGEKAKVEAGMDKVKRDWEGAHDSLAQKMDERSIPLSMGQPMVAMVNLWGEVREDLPSLVEKFVEQSGCVLVRGGQGWAPPMSPMDPNTAWIHLPIGTTGSGTTLASSGGGPLWVAGSLADIERLYKSLRNFPRILTIEHLGLVRLRDLAGTDSYNTVKNLLDRPEDEIMVAPVFLDIYLMCETPEGGGGAAAPAGGAGGMGGPGGPGGAPGMGGGGPGGPPGGSPAGGGPTAPPKGGGAGAGASGAAKGGADEGGAGKKAGKGEE